MASLESLFTVVDSTLGVGTAQAQPAATTAAPSGQSQGPLGSFGMFLPMILVLALRPQGLMGRLGA